MLSLTSSSISVPKRIDPLEGQAWPFTLAKSSRLLRLTRHIVRRWKTGPSKLPILWERILGQDALEPILLHLMPDGCSPETECCHMSDKFSGISAMVRAALWFEDQLNLTVLNIGRESFARKDSCTLQCCGTHLLHSIQIDGGWVSLEVTPMDQAEQPQKLLTIGDTKQGWSDLCQ